MKLNAIVFAAAFVSSPAFAQTTGVKCTSDHFLSMSQPGRTIENMEASNNIAVSWEWLDTIWFWDISNPEAMTLASSVSPFFSSQNIDIAISEPFVAISYESDGAVVLFDASDPHNPSMLSTINTPTNKIAMHGDTLYILATNSITAYDISNPSAPIQTGTAVGPENVNDVKVSGDYMYVAEPAYGLRIFNIFNPNSITQTSELATPLSPKSLNLSSSSNTLTLSTFNGGYIIDIANPAIPTIMVSTDAVPQAQGLIFENDRLFVSVNRGVLVFDYSSPSSPVFERRIAGPAIMHSPLIAQSQGNILLGGSKRLIVIDSSFTGLASSIESFVRPTFLPANINLTAIQIVNDFGFAIDSQSGSLITIDMSLPQNPITAGSLHIGSDLAGAIAISGTNAYFLHDSGTVSVVDISTPSAPALLTSWASFPPSELFMWGNLGIKAIDSTLYICPKTGGIVAYDITDPIAPVYLWHTSESNDLINIAFDVSHDRAALIGRTQEGSQSRDYASAWNIETSTPTHLGLSPLWTGQSDGNIKISGHYLYATSEQTAWWDYDDRCGFESFDISSQTTSLSLISFPSPQDGVNGAHFNSIAISGDTAYVPTSRTSSIAAFDISNPAAVEYLGSSSLNTPYPYHAKVSTIHGDRLYTAGSTGYIGIIDISDCSPTCQADLTGDGNLNFFDVSAFLNAFAANDPAADFTNDGLFNFFDVSAFLNAYAAGCS